MDKLIEAFSDNLKEGLAIAEHFSSSACVNEIKNVLICGMGGSGIGGKLVSDWVKNEINVPIVLSLDYEIPNFVDKNTLVIAASYSGNTEETVSAMKLAFNRNSKIVGISSGGNVEQFCIANKLDFIKIPGGNQPRAAIGYSLVQLLNIFSNFKLISENWKKDIQTSILSLNSNLEKNKAKGKEIAQFIHGKFPVIYTEAAYEGLGVRARQQFNENSKVVGWSLAIPEMNHNELVGWGGGNDHLAVLFIYTEDMNTRNRKRMDLSKEIIAGKTKSVYTLNAEGNSIIERSLYLNNVLDWASFYLHELNNVDVFDIKVINHLKGELAKI
jgi:glucose/mannose-6-phosphate isomerase